MRLENCFTADELINYISGTSEKEKRIRIASHLNSEKCSRCRRLFQLLENKVTHEPKNFIESGQIWSTTTKPKSMQGEHLFTQDVADPVLILDAGNQEIKLNNMIRVIPLSFDTEWHVPGETVVFDHNNIRFLAEIFGESPMLAGNLSQYKGRLSSNDMERVKKAVSDFYSGEVLNLTPDYINWRKEELEYIYLGLVAPVNLSI